jgi:hypothetical protein
MKKPVPLGVIGYPLDIHPTGQWMGILFNFLPI